MQFTYSVFSLSPFFFLSLGDGLSFVTRLVHIDPEQANSVLQHNGKRPVIFYVFLSNIQSLSWVLNCDVTSIAALLMERLTLVCLVTIFNTHRTTAKRKTVEYFFDISFVC